MKKDNTITVFYDAVTRKDIYRLNGVDVTDTIEMLKDKWERQILDTRCRLFQLDMSIQQRLQDQLALTKKALELACENISFENPCDYCRYMKEVGCPMDCENNKNFARDIAIKQFIEEAKGMMESE